MHVNQLLGVFQQNILNSKYSYSMINMEDFHSTLSEQECFSSVYLYWE